MRMKFIRLHKYIEIGYTRFIILNGKTNKSSCSRFILREKVLLKRFLYYTMQLLCPVVYFIRNIFVEIPSITFRKNEEIGRKKKKMPVFLGL